MEYRRRAAKRNVVVGVEGHLLTSDHKVSTSSFTRFHLEKIDNSSDEAKVHAEMSIGNILMKAQGIMVP